MNNYLVTGMYRTGHHAISVWMLHQFAGIKEFSINTVSPWMFAVEANGLHILANSPFKTHEHKDKSKFGQIVETVNPDTVILTHEQETIEDSKNEASKYPWFVKPKTVVIIREFKNWVASCVKMSHRDKKPVTEEISQSTIKLYDNHITSYLEDQSPERPVFILFDKWATDVEYREKVCEELSLTFTDTAKEQLSIFGGGSSFDNMNFLKNAGVMDVTNRYKAMEKDPYYRAYINMNTEVLLKSREIFA
jgi:hypothetical protein